MRELLISLLILLTLSFPSYSTPSFYLSQAYSVVDSSVNKDNADDKITSNWEDIVPIKNSFNFRNQIITSTSIMLSVLFVFFSINNFNPE